MTEISQTAKLEPKGIGGWLILPVIGTVLSPFVMAYWTFQSVTALDESLSTGLLAFIVIESVFNFGLMIAWIVAAVQLFRYKRMYPRLFVALLAITLVGTLLDVAVAAAIFDISVDANDAKGLARSAIGLAIWGPYMFKSKRVENTFVED